VNCAGAAQTGTAAEFRAGQFNSSRTTQSKGVSGFVAAIRFLSLESDFVMVVCA
jgi:hypothetical protein